MLFGIDRVDQNEGLNMKSKTKIMSALVVSILLMVALTPAFVTDDSEDSEAAIGGGMFMVGLTVGFFAGIAFTKLVLDAPSKDTLAGQEDELKKALAKAEMDKVYLAMKNTSDLIGSVMPADTQLVFFTQNYWDQAMEYQVYENWSLDNMGRYEEYCKEMLAGTGFLASENSYLYTWTDAFDYSFNDVLKQSALWTGDSSLEYTNNLSVSFVWDGYTLVATNGGESGMLSLDLTQQITTTNDTLVYIDVLEDTENYKESQSGTMYLYGTSKSVTIQNMDTGATFTLNPGANGITSLPAGVYKLPAGASYAGPMISVIGNSSASVHAGLVLKKGTDLYFATSYSDTQYRIVSSNGQSWITNNLNIEISDSVSTKQIHLLVDGGYKLLGYYEEMVSQFNDIASNTYTTGGATWKIFDTVEASNPAIHPSSIPINIEGQTLSMVEKYYLTIHAMAQIKEYFEANQGMLDDMEITFTANTLDLYCYGDLYYNGQLWAKNVVFTPYISGTDQHLEIGMNNWSGSGFMALWAQVDDYAQWDNIVSVSSPMSPLDKNYTLEIKKIVSGGNEVQSIDLKRSILVPSSQQDPEPDPEPTPMPKVYDAAILWMIVLIEAGIILLLLGRITGIGILSTLGIAIVVVGIVFPGAVSSLILGTFTWADLKPFDWI